MIKHENDSYSKNLKTILVLLTAAVIFYLYYKYLEILYVAIGIGVVSLISDRISFLIHKYWMIFGKLLGSIVSTLLLSLIFFIILTPIGILTKLTGNLELQNKNFGGKDSSYIVINKSYNSGDLENPW